MAQLIGIPGLQYPDNAVLNFTPVTNALNTYRQASDRAEQWPLQRNALMQEQDLQRARIAQLPLEAEMNRQRLDLQRQQMAHQSQLLPLQLEQTRAQTADIAARRALDERRLGYEGDRVRMAQEQAARGQVVEGGPGHQFYHIAPGGSGEPPRATPLAAVPPNANAQLTAGDRNAVLEADNTASAAREVQGLLSRAIQLNPQVIDGYFATQRGQVTRHEPTIEFGNLVTEQVLGKLRSSFGANPTEGERQIMLDVAGSANQPRGVRQRILQRALEAARAREAEAGSRARALRSGTYYQPNYGQPATQPAQPESSGTPPQQGGQTIPEGTIIRNGQGQRMILRNGQWQPL